jgi:hypothetical protein
MLLSAEYKKQAFYQTTRPLIEMTVAAMRTPILSQAEGAEGD